MPHFRYRVIILRCIRKNKEHNGRNSHIVCEVVFLRRNFDQNHKSFLCLQVERIRVEPCIKMVCLGQRWCHSSFGVKNNKFSVFWRTIARTGLLFNWFLRKFIVVRFCQVLTFVRLLREHNWKIELKFLCVIQKKKRIKFSSMKETKLTFSSNWFQFSDNFKLKIFQEVRVLPPMSTPPGILEYCTGFCYDDVCDYFLFFEVWC